MRTLGERLPPGWPVGLENDLLRRRLGVPSLAPVQVRHPIGSQIRFLGGGPNIHLLQRPPSEVAARRLWDRFAVGPLHPPDLLTAATLLGGTASFRTRAAQTTRFASGHKLEYLATERVPGRVARLCRAAGEREPKLHPLLHATGIFFETLLIHPLPDGNGRLARLLFQASLHRTLGLKAPVFPLGPACAANRPALMSAYFAWYFDRDAQPLVDFVTSALEALVLLYSRNRDRAV